VQPLELYPGLLITRRIRTRRAPRIKRREIGCDFNKDVYYFGYPPDMAINGKKNTTLDRESSTVKY